MSAAIKVSCRARSSRSLARCSGRRSKFSAQSLPSQHREQTDISLAVIRDKAIKDEAVPCVSWSNAADRNQRLARWRWIAPRRLRWPDCDGMTCRLSDRNTVMCEIFCNVCVTADVLDRVVYPFVNADDNQAS